MIIRNFLDAPGKIQPIHNSKGVGKNARVFDQNDFDTPLKFINYAKLEPGASIDVHRHGENEEVYVVLSGNGIMITNDERQAVKTGDIILNKPSWGHGIENISQEPLAIIVFEVDKGGSV